MPRIGIRNLRLHTPQFRRWRLGRWGLPVGLLMIAASGCQSGTYRAANLPPQFCCPPSMNSEEVNLSAISGANYNSSLIAPGDLLEVTIATGLVEDAPVPLKTRVADNGSISLPMIGPVHVAGLEAFEAGETVESQAIERGIYRRPQANVEIEQKAVNRVTVLGKVNEPGTHEIPRGATDLLTALAAAGGLAEDAGTLVEIRRQSPSMLAESGGDSPDGVQLAAYEQGRPFGPPAADLPMGQHYPSTTAPSGGRHPLGTVQVDLANPQQTAQHDLRLQDGDVVHVFPRPERMVYVGGLVREPGKFEIPRNRDLDLLQAVQMAGDKSSPVADKVVVIRHVPDRPEPIVIKAKLSGAKRNGRENIRLAAGDVVSVEQTPATVVVDTLMSFVRISLGVSNRATFF